MVEVLFKLGMSIAILAVAFGSVHWLWTKQIDVGKTLSRAFTNAVEPDWVSTRDPEKLYQGGSPVADVVGEVETEGSLIRFLKLANASNFDRGERFDYGRTTYEVKSVGGVIGQDISAGPSGSRVYQNVLTDVVGDSED